MENMQLIEEMAKLQVLCMRWVERNYKLKCCRHRDMDRILTSNKLTCTYDNAIKNLKLNIMKYCKDSKYLTESVLKLEKNIMESDIKTLRFGVEPQKKFTVDEYKLDNYLLKRQLFMITEMVSISYISEKFNLTNASIKQACQQNRLLNTKKVGNNWEVHIPEVLDYWKIKYDKENRLYKDWKY